MQIQALYIDVSSDDPVTTLWVQVDEVWIPLTVFAEGGYESLTGAGETSPTGQLIQGGPLTVNDQASSNTVAGFNILTTSQNAFSQGIVLNALNGSITVKSTAGSIQIFPNTGLGFFGVTPVARQAGAGITTVAQLVTALQNYGLLS